MKTKPLTTKSIISAAIECFGITKESFYSKRRNRPIPDVRFAVMKILKDEFPYSLKGIGAAIRPCNPMDHTTVIWGIKQANDRYETDKHFREAFQNTLIKMRENRIVPGNVSEIFNSITAKIQSEVCFTSMGWR